MNDFNRTIGSRIRTLREQSGVTREALAESADISPQFLANIENGTRGISARTAVNLARALRVSVDYLLTGAAQLDQTALAAESIAALPADERALAARTLRAMADILAQSRGKDR